MFGHPIQLNFNKEGTTKNSFIGGVISVCLKISMFVYVMINIKKLVLSEDDEYASEDFLLRHEDLELMKIPYNDLKFMFTPSIKKIRYDQFDKKFVYNEEIKKYIELEFAFHEKWIDGKTGETISSDNSTVTTKYAEEHVFPARLCNANDFKGNEELEEIFEISEKLKLNYYCPAFEDYEGDLTLSGS